MADIVTALIELITGNKQCELIAARLAHSARSRRINRGVVINEVVLQQLRRSDKVVLTDRHYQSLESCS